MQSSIKNFTYIMHKICVRITEWSGLFGRIATYAGSTKIFISLSNLDAKFILIRTMKLCFPISDNGSYSRLEQADACFTQFTKERCGKKNFDAIVSFPDTDCVWFNVQQKTFSEIESNVDERTSERINFKAT